MAVFSVKVKSYGTLIKSSENISTEEDFRLFHKELGEVTASDWVLEMKKTLEIGQKDNIHYSLKAKALACLPEYSRDICIERLS